MGDIPGERPRTAQLGPNGPDPHENGGHGENGRQRENGRRPDDGLRTEARYAEGPHTERQRHAQLPYAEGAYAGAAADSPAAPGTSATRARPRAAVRLARGALAVARRPYWRRPDSSWLVRRWPGLTATCAATVFFWLSLTPSLVPRPWPLQGLIGGITAAIGYALGAAAHALFRFAVRQLRRLPAPRRLRTGRRTRVRTGRPARPGRRGDRADRRRARAWQLYYAAATGLTIAALSQSARMQRKLRRLQDLPATLTWHSVMITLLALLLCAALVLLARCVRLGTRTLIRGLGRFVPRPVAIAAGLLISATLVLVATRDLVFERGVVDIASRIAASTNSGTRDGITPPRSPLVSGGPHSLVRWSQLGYEGRNFTGSALSARKIARVTGRPATTPIRVYVGKQAADAAPAGSAKRTGSGSGSAEGTASADPYARGARLAVAELERTGAFDRDVLAIAGTTGSGWVNSADAEPLEYLHAGNTAIVATQYSYLPSWLSFLVDRDQAGRANRALIHAVRQRRLRQPPAHRPRLVVFGESLGAYGVEAAFGSGARLQRSVDGAVLAGSPHYSPIRRRLTAARDRGSPVWRPTYRGGRHFRFAQWPARDLARPAHAPWRRPRVVYLQNASDPVVWWSWDLALHRPAWLRGPRGPDVTEGVRWFPVVTFWQTTVDLAVSYGVDAPHGHRYGTGAVEAWAAVAPPRHWTAADTAQLKRYMDARKAPY